MDMNYRRRLKNMGAGGVTIGSCYGAYQPWQYAEFAYLVGGVFMFLGYYYND